MQNDIDIIGDGHLNDDIKQLLEQATQFSSLVRLASLSHIHYIDLQKPIKSIQSKRTANILGYADENLDWQKIVVEPDWSQFTSNFQSFVESKKGEFYFTIRLLNTSNQIIFVEVIASFFKSKNTSENQLLGVVQLQNSYRSQPELRHLPCVWNNPDLGLWEWNVQTGETRFNEKWANIIGYDLSELGEININTWLENSHPDDLELSGEALNKYWNGETQFYTCEVRMKHKNGHWVWVHDIGQTVNYTDDGKPLWMTGTHQEITKYKASIEELEEAVALQKQFVENAPTAIAMFDKNMCYLSASNKWYSDYGISDEIIGKSHYEIFPEIGDDWKDLHKRGLKGEVLKHEGERFERTDGSVQWIRWENRPWFKRNGEVGGLIMFTDDISESKEQQYKIIKYKELIDETDKIALIGNWDVDLEKEEVRWSDTCYEMFDISKDITPTFETVLNLYRHEKDKVEKQELVQACIEARIPYDKVYEFITASGTIKHIRTIGIPVFKDDRCIGFHGFFQDVSESVNMYNQLAHQEDLFRKTFENAPNGIGLVSLEGKWMRVNSEISSMLEYTEEELLKLDFQTLTHPEDLESDLELLNKTLEGAIDSYQIEKRYFSKSKKMIHALLSVSLIRDESNQPLFFVSQIQDITSIKIANEQFRKFFRGTPDPMLIINQNRKIIHVNDVMTEQFGFKRSLLKGSEITDYLIQHDLRDLTSNKSSSIITIFENEDFDKVYESKVEATDGKVKPVAIRMNKMRLNGENYLTVAIRDVTEKKEADKLIRRNVRKFRAIFNNTIQLMALINPKGEIVELNETFKSFVGDADRYISRSFWQLPIFDEETVDKEFIKQQIELVSNDTTTRFEIELKQSDKSYYTFDFGLKPIVTETGKVEGIIVEAHPIQKLVDARMELTRALNQIKSILDASTQVCIIGTNSEGKILLWNKGAENILNIPRSEALEKLNIYNLIDQLESDLNRAKFLNTIRKNLTADGFSLSEHMFKRSDNSLVPIMMTVTEIKNQSSVPEGFLFVGVDITKRKTYEQEIKSLLDVTQQQNERLLNFAHIVSHNLRSHSGNFSMLMDIFSEELPGCTNNQYFQMLLRASENLKETISNLNEVVLTYSNPNIELVSINLLSVIQKAVNTAKVSYLQKNASINIDVPNNIFVLAVPAYLDSIILNLLTNAFKYAAPNRDLTLSISAFIKGSYVVLSVQDNGLGIDLKNNINKLFGLYKTFHGNDDARGVGLFITKNQIEAMGGKIEVESEVNVGTNFIVHLKNDRTHEKN